MFKLVITDAAENKVYWTDYFKSRAQLEAWLNEEVRKPYWKSSYTPQVIDLTLPPPTQAELDAIAAEEEKSRNRRKMIREKLKQPDLTADEIKQVLIAMARELFS